eukprot:5441516-Pyramimonas_sp.AAC.1
MGTVCPTGATILQPRMAACEQAGQLVLQAGEAELDGAHRRREFCLPQLVSQAMFEFDRRVVPLVRCPRIRVMLLAPRHQPSCGTLVVSQRLGGDPALQV